MPSKTISPVPRRFIGCDVGKRHIVAFDSVTARIVRIDNQPDALAAFTASLDASCLVVCEATGGHEMALLDALAAAGVPAHRADARKVKAFIRSFGTLGKSDAIDARALASYGAERYRTLARWCPTDPQRLHLQALVLTRRDLIDNRTAHTNRLKAPGAQTVAEYLNAVIACLQHQIHAIDAEIQALIARCEALARTSQLLQTIPSIGAITAAELSALMPELGTLNRKQAAALAGLAPHPKDSGLSHGYRRTKGGRPQIKRTLFMAALSASRHHPTLKPFAQRLHNAGKKPIVTQTAVMRKLVVIANAKIRDQSKQLN